MQNCIPNQFHLWTFFVLIHCLPEILHFLDFGGFFFHGGFIVTLLLVLQGFPFYKKRCDLWNTTALSLSIFILSFKVCLLQPQQYLFHWADQPADGSRLSLLAILFHVIFGQKVKLYIPFERKFSREYVEP